MAAPNVKWSDIVTSVPGVLRKLTLEDIVTQAPPIHPELPPKVLAEYEIMRMSKELEEKTLEVKADPTLHISDDRLRASKVSQRLRAKLLRKMNK